jgi:hypothetical protein
MNITPNNNRDAFDNFVLHDPTLNEYQYKFLTKYIEKTNLGMAVVYGSSLLNVLENGWIIILHGKAIDETPHFHIYGENWSENQFLEIRELFDMGTIGKSLLTGDSELIKKLVAYYNVNYIIQKERIFYKTRTVVDIDNNDLRIESATTVHLKELAIMLQQYYYEEYNGRNNKSIKEMEENISVLIASQSIFVSKNIKKEIVGFCTIVNPDIGILFTKNEYRNKGYGKYLLSKCSLMLKEYSDEMYLMTDKEKTDSNKAVSRVGYVPFYNYIMMMVN